MMVHFIYIRELIQHPHTIIDGCCIEVSTHYRRCVYATDINLSVTDILFEIVEDIDDNEQCIIIIGVGIITSCIVASRRRSSHTASHCRQCCNITSHIGAFVDMRIRYVYVFIYVNSSLFQQQNRLILTVNKCSSLIHSAPVSFRCTITSYTSYFVHSTMQFYSARSAINMMYSSFVSYAVLFVFDMILVHFIYSDSL